MFWANNATMRRKNGGATAKIYIYILIMLLNVFLSVDFYKSYVRLETGWDIQSDL